MKFIKRLIAILVILGAAFLGGAYLLPQTVSVARSTVINAPAEAIFPQINDLRATQTWSPWLDRDPDVQVTFSGPDSGVGNAMVWVSEDRQVGTGRQEITASVLNERVDSALDFGPMGTARAALILRPVEGGTEVTWTLDADMGTNPVGRYMGLMMDRWVGGDYEIGLERLKTLVEAGA